MKYTDSEMKTNVKTETDFVNLFKGWNAGMMESTIEALTEIAEKERLKEEIDYFDMCREKGDTIESMVCHSIGSDDNGTYTEYSITLRHKPEEE